MIWVLVQFLASADGRAHNDGMGVKAKVEPKQKSSVPLRTRSWRWAVLGTAFTGLIVGIVHWPVLSAQALSFDDSIYLFENPSFRQPGFASLGRFFGEVLHSPTVEGYYEPLTLTSLMIDVAAGGRADDLRPFHRTSLVLHVANTMLVVIFLYGLFGELWAAVLVGLLFGLHPLTVEPVSWVWERKTLLATFFTLASLIAYVTYVRHRNWGAYIAALIGFVLAVLAKPTSVPLPVILLLLDWWPLSAGINPAARKPVVNLAARRRRIVVEKMPFFVVAGISALITIFSTKQNVGIALPTEFAPGQMLGRVCYLLVFYFSKIVWPANLSSSYAAPASFALSEPRVLVSVVVLTFILIALAISLKRTRAGVAGFFIFLAAISPTLGIIGYSWVIASDKYVYLPALGIVLALCSLIVKFKPWRTGIIAGVVLLAGAEALGTRSYLQQWKDTQTFSEYMLRLNPDSPAVLNQLANVLSNQGKSAEAVELYQRAIRIEPRLYSAYYNLGLELAQHRRPLDAIECFEMALQLKPNFAKAHTNLAVLLSQQQEIEPAIAHLQQALRFEPDSPRTHNNLANIFAQRGESKEAETHYREAIRLDANYSEAHSNYAVLLAGQGRVQEAGEHYAAALRLQPRFPEGHNNLALLLMQQGKVDEAIQHYRAAISIRPDYADARMNLAAAFLAQKQNSEAVEQYQEVLRIRPDDSQAKVALQQLTSRPQ